MSESRGDIIGDKNSLAQKHMGLVHSCCKHFTGKGVRRDGTVPAADRHRGKTEMETVIL